MKKKLTIEYWSKLKKTYSEVMDRFLTWIDQYKKYLPWEQYFRMPEDLPDSLSAGIKFHDLPDEMQVGIFYKFLFQDDLNLMFIEFDRFITQSIFAIDTFSKIKL